MVPVRCLTTGLLVPTSMTKVSVYYPLVTSRYWKMVKREFSSFPSPLCTCNCMARQASEVLVDGRRSYANRIIVVWNIGECLAICYDGYL